MLVGRNESNTSSFFMKSIASAQSTDGVAFVVVIEETFGYVLQ